MRAHKMNTEIRREQIVQAALDLMSNSGVQDLSIAHVAERVGLVPSGIYRHFKSKDDLLNATLDLIGKKLSGEIAIVRQETSDPLEQLRMLLMREIQLLQNNQAIPHIVFSENIFTDSDDRKRKMGAIMTRYFHEIEKIIMEAQKKKRIRNDVPAMTVVLMFKGIILPAIVLSKVSDKRVDLVQHAESAWTLFGAAIALPS